ncbi:MAG: glycosyltransferase family 2 protein [Chlorogloeopsis fritschii C42_A2020_084]|uniref:glycosyltransferase family 2 protein n=1 Tax=Chlorogloeopsis fritschii TaxID=1124 RepID=UPI0019FE98C9|nr:glycosyltransferase family 2 protein [Chlorogloeopsis fritschii]MBF2009671.1 glycosyltransferase family 2 protein [Chlorogloeopsis fritschii C42_A2020_084]
MIVHQLAILFVEIVLFAIALGLFVPVSIFFIECSAALLPEFQIQSYYALVPRPRVDILVPAHNEAAGIDATLQSLLPQLVEQDRLIVIADNCNDDTASVAHKAGATVISRQDPERRGKGYALDYGLQFIAKNPPDVVVMVDADCIVYPGAIARISRLALATARPVQAVYLLTQPPNPQPKDIVSALAFMVKNLVRPRGLGKLDLPCLLMGSGMAFPWQIIHKVSVASSNIVEDIQLTMDLAIAGYSPKFCLDALVMGTLPQQQHAATSQRTRWEHGYLQTMLKQVPRLLKASYEQKRFDLLAIALDLCVPPLSLLVTIWATAIAGATLAGVLGSSWLPTILLVVEGLLICISIVAVWVKFGRTNFPLRTMLTIPLYILWKIPLYLAFLFQPQTEWIRTQRDSVVGE